MLSVNETDGTSGLSTCIVHILNTFLLMAAFSKLMRPGVGWTRTGLLHHGVAEIISCPLLAAAQRCDNFTRPCRWSPSPAARARCHEPGPDTDGWSSGPQYTSRYCRVGNDPSRSFHCITVPGEDLLLLESAYYSNFPFKKVSRHDIGMFVRKNHY